jgi:hypothetical protein
MTPESIETRGGCKPEGEAMISVLQAYIQQDCISGQESLIFSVKSPKCPQPLYESVIKIRSWNGMKQCSRS